MAHNTETDKSDQPYNLILLKDTIYEDVQLENDHKLITGIYSELIFSTW